MTISEALKTAFSGEIYKCVLSGPRAKSENYRKIEITRNEKGYLVEKYTDTQVFHENLSYDGVLLLLNSALETTYRNLNSWDSENEHSILMSKKGKLSYKKQVAKSAPKERASHNREKNYILKAGTHIEPLVDMGIFTAEGKVVNSMYDKYKQINRFIEIVDDEIGKINKSEITVLDFGCGKSYLTFILYYYFTEIRKMKINMIGLDLKRDVIEKCTKAAEKYGYEGLKFQVGDIGGFNYDGKIDVVITLHACDTATDFALYNAIKWDADMIFSVPCCQHELNGQIETEELSLLTRYGIVKERFSALLTDAVRCNLLEYCGYRTKMVEFVAFDHTPKNIMIRSVKQGRKNEKALSEVRSAMAEFNVDPALYRLLKDSGIIDG